MSKKPLVAENRNYKSLIENSTFGIFQADINLKIVNANPVLPEIFGIDTGSIFGYNLSSIGDPGIIGCLERSLKGEFVSYKGLFSNSRAVQIEIKFQSGPLNDNDGKIIGVFGIVNDCTFELQSIEDLKQSENRFRTLVESSEDKIFLLDKSGKVTGVFGKWIDKMELAREAIIGKTLDEIFGVDLGAVHLAAAAEALKGELVVYEWDYEKDSSLIHIQESLSPIISRDGSISGLLSIGRDVTNLKKIEDTLRSKARQLEVLYNAGRTLGRSLNLDQNFDALHQSLRSVVPCDGFFISSYNPAQNVIRCEAAWMEGESADISGFPELILEEEGRGTQSIVIRSGESMILNDYEASLRTAQSVHHVNPEGSVKEEIPEDVDRTRSAMIIPLKLEHEVIGVLQIFSYRLNAYSDEHLKLAEALAFQGAAAQNNALLYKMAQDEVAERGRAELLQNALYRIAQTVHQTESLNELLEKIHGIIGEVLPASSFYFSFYDSDSNLITFPYFHDDYDTKPIDRKPIKGLTEFVLQKGTPYLWKASQSDPTEGGLIEVIGKDAAVWLGVPLIDEGKTIGVMAVQHYSNENAYGSREQQILNFVATEIARAITAMSAVKSIRESEDKYRSLIENTREGIFLIAGNKFELVNQPFCELFGYTTTTLCATDFNPLQLIVESQREKTLDYARRLKAGEALDPHMELLLISAENREFEAEISTNAITYKGRFAIQGVVRDISQRRRIEAQLLQTAKLEAIGRLAGGVAHDFNNLLTALTGTAELILLKMTPDNPNHADIEQILTIARRGSNLTQQLLAFARSQPQKPRIVQLNTIVTETQQMLRRLIGDSIKLKVRTFHRLPNVKADPSQLEMALMNLVVNSRDAMKNSGEITITTSTETIDAIDVERLPDITACDYCVLTVSDQGSGMPKEILARATEPFFTTKPIGKGTGLGLSTVHGIARQSGGFLNIQSEVGIGTTVKLYLPVCDEKPEQESPVETKHEANHGRETILVCDDEDTVRQVAVRILQAKGYNVLEATEGEHAIKVAGEYEGKIDLLLTDMAMPVMGGPELSQHMKTKYPDLRVIMMSGYSPMAFPADYNFKEPPNFIQKPFRAFELSKKVREMLDRPHEQE